MKKVVNKADLELVKQYLEEREGVLEIIEKLLQDLVAGQSLGFTEAELETKLTPEQLAVLYEELESLGLAI